MRGFGARDVVRVHRDSTGCGRSGRRNRLRADVETAHSRPGARGDPGWEDSAVQRIRVSNLERRTPVTAKTVFAIASVSKQFLAAGAMVLVQEGKLSLDNSVAPYLTPPNWRPITIRELLTHTSGLPGNAAGENPFETRPLLDSIRSAYGAPLSFPPGERWQYSNLGYYVLAEISRACPEIRGPSS